MKKGAVVSRPAKIRADYLCKICLRNLGRVLALMLEQSLDVLRDENWYTLRLEYWVQLDCISVSLCLLRPADIDMSSVVAR